MGQFCTGNFKYLVLLWGKFWIGNLRCLILYKKKIITSTDPEKECFFFSKLIRPAALIRWGWEHRDFLCIL